jgi:hypothetical protein
VRGIDVSKVSYWIEQDTKRKVHGFVKEQPIELAPPNGPVHRDSDVTEVAQDVAFINFRYFDGSTWLEAWDSSQTGTLPKAVEVTVYVHGVWRDEDVFEPFMSRFYLPVAAETPQKTQ